MHSGGHSFKLAVSAPAVLALGGGLKNTLCAVRGDTAFVSASIGNLDNADACLALEAAVDQLCEMHGIEPAVVAHDLHPDFFSTRLAVQIAARRRIPALGVQHHHAHVAAVCAELGLVEPVLGLAMDGVGLGSDGQAWGGELLRLEGARFERLGHLQPLRLPGGDRAARETWRMGAAALDALGRNAEIARRFADQPAATTVAAMLQSDFNCPPTSSLGRLFDAACGLLGLCPRQSFEGQASMALQALAEAHGDVDVLPGGYQLAATLDFRPLLAVLADGLDAVYGAALFHATLAAGLADWASAAAARYDIRQLACGGGCFLNQLLLRQLSDRLLERGVQVLVARRLSPGDAGLSLGQAWVAIRHWQEN
jgi:hydrogenase maturation protein HypF